VFIVVRQVEQSNSNF